MFRHYEGIFSSLLVLACLLKLSSFAPYSPFYLSGALHREIVILSLEKVSLMEEPNKGKAIWGMKGTWKVKVKTVNTGSLKTLHKMLKPPDRNRITEKHGNIWALLSIEVQEGAITALTQFYDPPLRCFTFQDFQLAPTLEEYGLILGIPLKNERTYTY